MVSGFHRVSRTEVVLSERRSAEAAAPQVQPSSGTDNTLPVCSSITEWVGHQTRPEQRKSSGPVGPGSRTLPVQGQEMGCFQTLRFFPHRKYRALLSRISAHTESVFTLAGVDAEPESTSLYVTWPINLFLQEFWNMSFDQNTMFLVCRTM